MSKFVERLRRAAEGAAQPMGFSPVVRQRVPPLVLAAHLPRLDGALAAAAARHGAEFLLFSTEDGRFPGSLPPSGIGETPWGVRLPSLAADQHQALKEAGCDFVLIDCAETPARLLAEEEMAVVAAVSLEAEDRWLRAVDQLPFAAILIEAEAPEELTVRRLLEYAAVASGLGQSLVAPASSRWGCPEMEQLREIGISGLVMKVTGEGDLGGLQALQNAVLGLPARPKRREGRSHARLPHLAPGAVGREEEEQEDDDDDDG